MPPFLGAAEDRGDLLSSYSIAFKNLYSSLSVERITEVFLSKVFSKVSIDFKKAYRFCALTYW